MKNRLLILLAALLCVAIIADARGFSRRKAIEIIGVTTPTGSSGSGESATGDATAADVLTGKTFSNAEGADIAGSMPNIGAQNITPGTASQLISEGYHNGSGAVEGDADLTAANIASGVAIFGVEGTLEEGIDTSDATAVAGDILDGETAYVDGSQVTGAMPNIGTQNITPGTSSQLISEGYHNGSGSVSGDAGLVPGNIATGATIFGVLGTLDVGGLNTSDATAEAGSILDGDTAYVNGAKITGVMPNIGAQNITPGTSSQSISEGYHNGSGVVAGDADLAAANIASGTEIFGVTGTLKDLQNELMFVGELPTFISSIVAYGFTPQAGAINAYWATSLGSNKWYFRDAVPASDSHILITTTRPVTVSGFAISQTLTTQEGVWDFCGKNDGDADWTVLYENFEWGGTTFEAVTFENSTAYTYYKFQYKSGSTSNDPWQNILLLRVPIGEIE